MKMIRIICFAALSALAFTACKKEDNPLTKTEMLVGGKWTLTALRVSPAYNVNGVAITDVFASYPACFKDDFQSFAANGTYTYDEGAVKCDPADAQTTTGTWKFNAAETQLTLSTSSETDIWEIGALSSSSMTSVYKLTENGVVYTFTGTLQKR